jgi:selenocysteine-specific elongation factor
VEEKLVRLAEHKIRLSSEEDEAVRNIEELYRSTALKPPYSRSLSKELGLAPELVTDLLRHLTETGRLIHIQGDLFMNPHVLEEAKEKIRAGFEAKGEISIPEIKEILNSTRKYLIPLLEYFDATGFTARKGDKRVLR